MDFVWSEISTFMGGNSTQTVKVLRQELCTDLNISCCLKIFFFNNREVSLGCVGLVRQTCLQLIIHYSAIIFNFKFVSISNM